MLVELLSVQDRAAHLPDGTPGLGQNCRGLARPQQAGPRACGTRLHASRGVAWQRRALLRCRARNTPQLPAKLRGCIACPGLAAPCALAQRSLLLTWLGVARVSAVALALMSLLPGALQRARLLQGAESYDAAHHTSTVEVFFCIHASPMWIQADCHGLRSVEVQQLVDGDWVCIGEFTCPIEWACIPQVQIPVRGTADALAHVKLTFATLPGYPAAGAMQNFQALYMPEPSHCSAS